MELIPWLMAIVIYAALFWIFGHKRCQHEMICAHGDNINHSGGDRSECIYCHKTFPDIPYLCVYTGEPHFQFEEEHK